jgi:ankyrin repeat protein
MKIINRTIQSCGLILALAFCFPLMVQAQQILDTEVVAMVQKGDVPGLSAWVANGGDIDQVTKEGNTLLMLASKIGDTPTVRYLLSQHSQVDAQNKVGTTALMLASKYGHTHIIKHLLAYNADPLIQNNSGITAARFAAVYKHDECYDLLRDAEKKVKAQKRKALS